MIFSNTTKYCAKKQMGLKMVEASQSEEATHMRTV